MTDGSNTVTNKLEGLREAARMASAKLRGVDLASRCLSLGLSAPRSDGVLRVKVLAGMLDFAGPEFDARVSGTEVEAHPIDRLLVLRYLLCDVPVRRTGRWITFREFPGGVFYFPSFRSRAVDMLVRAIGDDVDLLRSGLENLEWEEMDKGDFSASVRVFGNVELGLVYNRAGDGLPADLDVLFDSSLKRVYGAEEATALAARTCVSLSPGPCEVCIACGFCDRTMSAR